MPIIDRGHGAPLVLIPGLQGVWQYLTPAIDGLASFFRVLTFPLAGEPASGLALDPTRGFDNYADQVVAALDEKQIQRAIMCGVSFGGLIALRAAAAHPERTAALVLVSTPGPDFQLRKRHEIYSHAPWLFGPVFVAETPWRLAPELAAALPNRWDRIRFSASSARRIVGARVSLVRMAERARMIAAANSLENCARITAPTLVVTGERDLDRVVSVDATSEYTRLIRGARRVVLPRTGHLGAMTQPAAFAEAVRAFVSSLDDVEVAGHLSGQTNPNAAA